MGGHGLRSVVSAGAIAVAAMLLATCGSGGDDTLEKLQRDPMAEATLTMAEPVETAQVGANPGVMDEPASIVRRWRVETAEVDAALQELEDQARLAEWRLAAAQPLGARGEKDIEGTFAQLVISAIPSTGEVLLDLYARPD